MKSLGHLISDLTICSLGEIKCKGCFKSYTLAQGVPISIAAGKSILIKCPHCTIANLFDIDSLVKSSYAPKETESQESPQGGQ